MRSPRARTGSPRPPRRPPLAVLLLPALLAAAAPPQADALDAFRRSWGAADSPAARVEAVLILEDLESPVVVDRLVGLLDESSPEVVDAIVRVLAGFRTRPPVERMLEALAGAGEKERLGLLDALAAGGYPDLVAPLADSLADRRWPVRHAALRAVAAAGGEAAPAALRTALADGEPPVRCAALEGLARLAPELLLRAAPAALEDASWQVRACAIELLGGVRERRSVELLIGRLRPEEGRLRQDVVQRLEGLVNRSFGLDPEPWERFWRSVGEDWVPPTEEELRLLEARRQATSLRYADAVRYHGIETPSRALVFVIDVSASMDQVVVEPRARPGEEPAAATQGPSPRRIDLVKEELLRAIDALPSYATFNVLAFSTEVDAWRRDPVPASAANRRAASRWVERLDARTGSSEARTFRTRERISQAMAAAILDTDEGRTNTWAALQRALGVAGRGAFDRSYEAALDTILFLSDGSPSHGELIAPDDILREVARVNRLKRIVIHAIAIGEFNKDFMADLAHQNGGQYVDLGR